MTVLAGARVLTAEGMLAPGWVRLAGGSITQVTAGPPPPGAETFAWLAPGLVDMHCHGGGGASFESGDPEQVAQAATAHLDHGTTSLVASLVSAPPDVLRRQVAALVGPCEQGLLAGIHLEGPWLSLHYRGAHDEAALREPTLAELEALLAAGRGHVRMITIAPEVPGALPVIRAAVAAGVTVALGHTNATYEEARAAVDVGATVGTHLCNAMRPLRHRDPGPVAALTEDHRVTVELVADGVHLDPAMLRLAVRTTSGGISLVSDAMAAAAGPDGTYRLGGREVLVVGGVAKAVADGAIAGSTLTLAAAVRHAVASGAVDAESALRAATQAPARALGLAAAGTVAVGRRADLVALTEDLEVVRVWRGSEVRPGAARTA